MPYGYGRCHSERSEEPPAFRLRSCCCRVPTSHQINGLRSSTSFSGQSVTTSCAPRNCCPSAAIAQATVAACTACPFTKRPLPPRRTPSRRLHRPQRPPHASHHLMPADARNTAASASSGRSHPASARDSSPPARTHPLAATQAPYRSASPDKASADGNTHTETHNETSRQSDPYPPSPACPRPSTHSCASNFASQAAKYFANHSGERSSGSNPAASARIAAIPAPRCPSRYTFVFQFSVSRNAAGSAYSAPIFTS